MNPTEIICCHCGRDYAREYWAMQEKADPNVCKSCRRDLNRDAADAPRWVAGAHALEDDTPAVIVVNSARKQCRMCRVEWVGLIFGPPAAPGATLPFGICPACSDAEDAKIAAMSARVVGLGMPLPELARPRRTADV